MGIWNTIKNIMNEKETDFGDGPVIFKKTNINPTFSSTRSEIKSWIAMFDAFGDKDDLITKDARLFELLKTDIIEISLKLGQEAKELNEAINNAAREDAYYPQDKKDRFAIVAKGAGRLFDFDINTPLAKVEEIFGSLKQPLPPSFHAFKTKNHSFLPKEIINPVLASEVFAKCSEKLFDLILSLEDYVYSFEKDLRFHRSEIHKIIDKWPSANKEERVNLYEQFLTVIGYLDLELELREKRKI